MKKSYLTPAQERSLRTSLFLFEKALRSVDQLLLEGEEIGILLIRKSHLDNSLRFALRKKIADTLIELRQFVLDLGLKPFEESIERTIIAEMSTCWESLEESRSKRMRGYGDLDPRAAKMIDPNINHFAKIALELSRATLVDSSNDSGE